MLAKVRRSIPASVKRAVARVAYFGSRRKCPVCNSSVRMFHAHGLHPRSDARCPVCQLLERHRLAMLFLRRHTDFFTGAKGRTMLHVGPERFIEPIFAKAIGEGYLTADLLSKKVMENMDITDIPKPDNTFDIIFCSHVLEHVPDDRKAMSEFFRVLKPGGWAILNVPITAPETVEDPAVTDPKERERLYGQFDHVRRYGLDYKDRLAEAGFQVDCYFPKDIVAEDQVELYGIHTHGAGEIYCCRK